MSSGLSFLDAGGARAAALGEAFSATPDDANAFLYNPASLATLSSSQGSLYYRAGEEDERHGRFTVGTPAGRTGYGISVASYDSGTIEAHDGTTTRTVTAQSDLSAALGGALTLGRWSAGLSGKYLSSQLVESARAQAFAFDAGLGLNLGPVRLGGAVQNIGQGLKYQDAADPLPRLMRVGASYQLPIQTPATLSVDVPYFMNEKDTRPSVALETLVGPLAIRGGVRRSSGELNYSIGAGFSLARVSFDYAFAATGLNARHEAGLSFRFGRSGQPLYVEKNSKAVASRPTLAQPKARQVASASPATVPFVAAAPVYKGPRVYHVKQGDTLSVIAERLYGNRQLWTLLYQANRHLLNNPSELEPGQQLVLPQ